MHLEHFKDVKFGKYWMVNWQYNIEVLKRMKTLVDADEKFKKFVE